MKTINQVALEMQELCKLMDGYQSIRTPGNLGMALIASAINDHADAVRVLARAVERLNEKDQITNIFNNTYPSVGITRGPAVVDDDQAAVRIPVSEEGLPEACRPFPPPDHKGEQSPAT
jgi:hypothetical protein